jgi:hypothetical protein
LFPLQVSEKPAEVAVAAPPEKVLVGILWVGMAKMVRMRMRMPTHFAGISFFWVCVDERGFCYVGGPRPYFNMKSFFQPGLFAQYSTTRLTHTIRKKTCLEEHHFSNTFGRVHFLAMV